MVFIFYSFIITTYLKKLIGIKFFSIKQCQAELSSRFILLVFPTIPKMSPPPFPPACCSYNKWTALPLHSNLLFGRNLLHGGERILPSNKKVLISQTRKIPLTKQQFSIQVSFITAVIAVVSLFLLQVLFTDISCKF